MKTPKEMAENFFAHNDYNEFSADEVFVIGYKVAQDQIADMRNYLEKAFQAGHLFMTTGVDFDEWYARVFLAKQQLADVSKVMTKPPKEEV